MKINNKQTFRLAKVHDSEKGLKAFLVFLIVVTNLKLDPFLPISFLLSLTGNKRILLPPHKFNPIQYLYSCHDSSSFFDISSAQKAG